MNASTRGMTAISWSAGKDSFLAWLRLREQGVAVSTFVTMCEPDGTSKSHALGPELIEAQVASVGGRWMPVRVPPGAYAATFDAALRRLRDTGHERIAFGDIDLAAHREWLEPACARAGLQAVFPLWGESRLALAREVIARNVRARLVAVDTSRLDASFAGALYDEDLLARLPPDVCPCGETGEFHTFVFEAPGMSAPLPIRDGRRHRLACAAPHTPSERVVQELRLAAGKDCGR